MPFVGKPYHKNNSSSSSYSLISFWRDLQKNEFQKIFNIIWVYIKKYVLAYILYFSESIWYQKHIKIPILRVWYGKTYNTSKFFYRELKKAKSIRPKRIGSANSYWNERHKSNFCCWFPRILGINLNHMLKHIIFLRAGNSKIVFCRKIQKNLHFPKL